MNFNLYKEFYFAEGKLTSCQSGKIYNFRLDKDDRFYSYIKPHFIAGKVSGQTKLMIDTMEIINGDGAFLNEGSFTLEAFIVAKDRNDVCTVFDLCIKNIKINNINVSRISYKNDCLILTLYEMEIPYQTTISIKEHLE